MGAPTGATQNDEALSFVKDGARVDAATGAVTFYINYQGKQWKCQLRRGDNPQKRAAVQVLHNDDSPETITTATLVTQSLNKYFNELVFELDGTSLSFTDMMVTGRGAAPSVMFALNILVRKLPSRSVAF